MACNGIAYNVILYFCTKFDILSRNAQLLCVLLLYHWIRSNNQQQYTTLQVSRNRRNAPCQVCAYYNTLSHVIQLRVCISPHYAMPLH